MSKELMLEKAFNQIASNGAVRFACDRDADFDVIRTAMIGYAKKNNVQVEVSEIEGYIEKQFANLDKMTINFSFQKKMMN